MNNLEIALPGTILLLSFLLKLFVDRTATVPDFISAIFELPVDVAFLATSLIAAFTLSLSDKAKIGEGLISFVIYVVGAVLIVVLWRRSLRSFLSDKIWISFLLTGFGYLLCVYGLVYAVNLVTSGGRP